jgi:phospholipid-translocating ATPase
MNQDRKFSDFEGLVEMKDLASTKTLIKSNPRKAPNLPANADLEDNQTPFSEEESPSPTSKGAGIQAEARPSLFTKLYYYFTNKRPVSTSQRVITFDRNVYPPSKFENIVRNQKYSLYSFVFVVLYNQFKFFFNFFFLMIALSQFVDALKVGFLFTYIAPLAFVLILTMIKEAVDDYNRYKQDKEANSQMYKVYASSSAKIDQPSSALKVGDIIEVHANQRVPADLLLLYTSDESGTVFIRTDQLDGETDWKLRKPVKYTQKIVEGGRPLFGINTKVTAEAPRAHIYDFIGKVESEAQRGPGYTESLSLENTMWANTVLASGMAYAMVLYTGKETRMSMNAREPRSKIGNLDNELNTIAKYLFVFMLFLSGVIMVLRGFGLYWYLQYFKYMLLLSSIIPISLRVNLDFAKAVFSYRINNDHDIEGTIARNSTIPEELGRVQFLLTDKTGTLTQNEMIFKKLCLEGVQYDESCLKDMERILKKQCAKNIGPAKDVEERIRKEEIPHDSTLGLLTGGKKKKCKRDKEVLLSDLITALCVCHNVTPVIED